MTSRSYASPAAFKQALEQRLRAASGDGAQFARRRQLLVFDRFLARVVAKFGSAVTLKGGLVLELRIGRARTTKDVDLRLVGSANDLLGLLQQCAGQDLGDFMTFEVGPDRSALHSTFAFRKTHALPTTLPAPPPTWETPYAAMAREDQLKWPTLIQVTRAASDFLDPVLAGSSGATWDPSTWSWRP